MYFKANNPALITVPLSGSTRWNVGKPLDAGTLQIFQNNLATFQVEHGRTLATQNGGLSNIFFDNTSETTKRGFGQSRYPAPASFGSASINQQLAWGSDVALKFGPFYLPSTSTGFASADYLPINVAINITGSAGSDVYVAVNGGENPFTATPYSMQKVTFGAGTGFYLFETTTVREKPATEENVTWMNSNTAYEFDSLSPLYVWVGVYRANTDTNFMSITVSDPRFV